jgi:hypothetical protein
VLLPSRNFRGEAMSRVIAEIHTMLFKTSTVLQQSHLSRTSNFNNQQLTNLSPYTLGYVRLFRKTVFESGLANTMFLPTYVSRESGKENIDEHVHPKVDPGLSLLWILSSSSLSNEHDKPT